MKAAKLAMIRHAIASGKDVDEACREARVPRGTYYRWQKAVAAAGLAGLRDGKPTGRPKSLTLTRAETLGLRGHALLADFRFGGFDGHLFRVAQKFTSRGKGGLENSFGPYQDFLKHKATSIGAVRGEFDRASRLYRAAHKGVPEALAAFWSMGESAAATVEALAHYNQRPQLRRAFGGRATVPAEQWSQHQPRQCPADEMWRFFPVKKPITVRAGVVEMKVDHYPLSFRFLVHGSPGLPCLEHGHRLFVAFHPGQPELGCRLFNAELAGSIRNRDRLRLLEPLGTAGWWPDVPQENFAATRADFDPQRRASAALRSEFRAAFPGGAGALIKRSGAKDVYGRLAADPIRVATTPEPGSAEAPRPRRHTAASLVDLYSHTA